ncbi:MAG: Sec-dependent nitrous-oxide reductase [Bacteroidetes bacterium]|nr:Sec-dependent nitrous-oxide reductase [Bacteroidota bacterium]
MKTVKVKIRVILALSLVVIAGVFYGCKPKDPLNSSSPIISGGSGVADEVYVAPGEKDDYYLFTSGGFSGQLGVYGLPSGRLIKQIPIFSQHAENGWGYSEETKPMLETSYGFVPWDDSHHPKLSQTDGKQDGRWLFINGNNTPRIARIDLKTYKTVEINEIPNSAGNHSSPYPTPNTEYVVAGTRFSVPIDETDVSIDSYKENFRGMLSYISVAEDGAMDVAFQILMPGYDYDLSHAGKGPSHGWSFFTTYNTEESNTMKEVNASQRDKDFLTAVNWKMAEELVAAGKYKTLETREYRSNRWDEATHSATSQVRKGTKVIDASEHPGLVYFMPCPKSPHGVDVNPTGEYIVASGKLAATLPVFKFSKIQEAIANKDYEGTVHGIPVLKYESVLAGEVEKPGLGPLHTEFDGKGYAYTSMFVSSEITKWKVETQEVVDRIPTYYSIGHLCIPGGDTREPVGDYVIALNKITKDRYLPTGPELTQSAQLINIAGDKMRMLLDFPTIGEPHYAQACKASLITDQQVKFYKIEENDHPYAAKGEKEAEVIRNGNEVHIKMTSVRSHFAPDNIEGIKVGDKVYWHITNLEQDWDVPHGFAVQGARNAELLIMPGETATLVWEPKEAGVVAFYCTDFCSALHQEMQGYVRVSPADSDVELSWSLNKAPATE